jgi:hypothetical protein
MPSFSVINCDQVDHSAAEDYLPGAVAASANLICDWNDRYALVDDLLLNRRQWPFFTVPTLIAKTAKITALPTKGTTATQIISYQKAIVAVKYATLDAEEEKDEEDGAPNDGVVVTDSIKPAAEFITQDPRNFTWETAPEGASLGAPPMPVTEGQAPGMLIHTHTLSRVLGRVLNIPASILTLPGSVNAVAYTSNQLGLTYPAETLMFGIPSITFEHLANGVTTKKLTLEFSYKPNTWNKYYRPDKLVWEHMMVAAQPAVIAKMYPPGDFSEYLF